MQKSGYFYSFLCIATNLSSVTCGVTYSCRLPQPITRSNSSLKFLEFMRLTEVLQTFCSEKMKC